MKKLMARRKNTKTAIAFSSPLLSSQAGRNPDQACHQDLICLRSSTKPASRMAAHSQTDKPAVEPTIRVSVPSRPSPSAAWMTARETAGRVPVCFRRRTPIPPPREMMAATTITRQAMTSRLNSSSGENGLWV